MYARLDGGGGHLGEEAGGHLQGHGFHAAFQHFLVARQAGETSPVGHAQGIAALIRGFLEVVGHGVHLIAAVLFEQPGDPASAAAATDHSQFDFAFGVCFGGRIFGGEHGRSSQQRPRRRGGQCAAQKATP